MEPEAQTIAASTMIAGNPTAESVAVVSIAISLKRIADAMQSPNEYGEVGGAAIAGAISRSLRDR